MRIEGTLKRWNDDKGYGFIAPALGGVDVFVHVSAFPNDGQRPQEHEALTFEMERGADGRMKALRVQRAGQPPGRAAPVAVSAPVRRLSGAVPSAPTADGGRGTTLVLLLAVVLVGAGAYAYHWLAPRPAAVASPPTLAVAVPARPVEVVSPAPRGPEVAAAPEMPVPRPARASMPLPAPSGQFACDGRTQCSQMTSCAEAEYFLKHCPGVKMDGNGDGEPCEQQWCTR